MENKPSKENPNSNIFLSVNNSKPKILELIIEEQKEENISNKSNDNNDYSDLKKRKSPLYLKDVILGLNSEFKDR